MGLKKLVPVENSTPLFQSGVAGKPRTDPQDAMSGGIVERSRLKTLRGKNEDEYRDQSRQGSFCLLESLRHIASKLSGENRCGT